MHLCAAVVHPCALGMHLCIPAVHQCAFGVHLCALGACSLTESSTAFKKALELLKATGRHIGGVAPGQVFTGGQAKPARQVSSLEPEAGCRQLICTAETGVND